MNDTRVVRPPGEGSTVVTARLPLQLEREVSALAARRGLTRSALLRALVENAVALESEVPAA